MMPYPHSSAALPTIPTSQRRKKMTHKSSKQIFGATIQVILALVFVVFGAGAALAQTNAYVSNRGDNTVSVINTAANTVTATIPVGSNPNGIAVTPNGAILYVVNSSSNNVSVINTASNTVTATVPVGTLPQEIAVSP